MTFTQAEIDYLATQRLGRLATAQPDGTLQVSPVGFHCDPELGVIDIAGLQHGREPEVPERRRQRPGGLCCR